MKIAKPWVPLPQLEGITAKKDKGDGTGGGNSYEKFSPRQESDPDSEKSSPTFSIPKGAEDHENEEAPEVPGLTRHLWVAPTERLSTHDFLALQKTIQEQRNKMRRK